MKIKIIKIFMLKLWVYLVNSKLILKKKNIMIRLF